MLNDYQQRFQNYSNDECWQYSIRKSNLNRDLLESRLTSEQIVNLKVPDFTLAFEEKEFCYQEVKQFIEKNEWLSTMSLYPTHVFTARLNGILAGVVVMDMPAAFSKLLGEGTRKLERLISRGACISWSPKNLGSALIMFAVRWMAKNTQYKLFTAYSDPEAKELGTIYQACNFYYLGQQSGATKQFQIESGKWVSDRYFRSRSVYKKLAKINMVDWYSEYQRGDVILWERMPKEVELKIRELSKNYQMSCPVRVLPRKHKYAYILGADSKETKNLKKLFDEYSKKLIKPYPKIRGQ